MTKRGNLSKITISHNRTLFWIIIFLIILFIILICFIVKNSEQDIEDNKELVCLNDGDCVSAGCCHSDSCVSADNSRSCENIFCTMDCVPNTLDCNQGTCKCINNKCEVVWR